MQQSSYPMAALPACLILTALAALPFESAQSQDRYRVIRQENFRREAGPTAGLLATINQGTELVGGATQSGWVEVTLEGWIWAQSLRSLTNPDFDYAVNKRSGENLRAEPDGRILARLIDGFWMEELESAGRWVRVTRTGVGPVVLIVLDGWGLFEKAVPNRCGAQRDSVAGFFEAISPPVQHDQNDRSHAHPFTPFHRSPLTWLWRPHKMM